MVANQGSWKIVEMSEIPKEELALYDRQIRLWGLEAQKKLRKGSMLIIAKLMSSMVQEICKNLALCGISSLKLELKSNNSAGKLMYSSLDTELVEIHPKLRFSCSAGDHLSSNFSDYDFVIVCDYDNLVDFPMINEKVRAQGKCCSFCFEVEGKFFMFNDFGDFTVNSSTSGPKTITFPSFENVLKSQQGSPKNYLLDLFYKIIQNDYAVKTSLEPEVAGSAIIGALVSQEVIKSFSKTCHPVNNLLIFDSKNLKNIVAQVGIIS